MAMRQFRVLQFQRRTRDVENGAPINVRAGEMLYDEEHKKIYVGESDGTVTTLVRGLGAVASNPAGIPGASAIANFVKISQADYDTLAVKNSSTIYIIEN